MVKLGTFKVPYKCKLLTYSLGRQTFSPYWVCSQSCPSCYIEFGFRYLFHGKKSETPVAVDVKGAIEVYRKLPSLTEIEASPSCDCFDRVLEPKYRITEKFLKGIKEIGRNDIFITFITKSHLIADYIELMNPELHVIQLTIESLKPEITSPNASSYEERFNAVKKLVKAGFKVAIRIDPIYPNFMEKKDYDKIITDFASIGIKHITISFVKVNRKQIDKLNKIFNFDLWKLTYREENGEFFIRDEIKRDLAEYIKNKCSELNLTFAMCREDCIEDSGFCDPFHLLPKWKKRVIKTLDDF
jgi:DNA repair photolyase